MPISLRTWSLLEAVLELASVSQNIVGYVAGYGAIGMFPSIGNLALSTGPNMIIDPTGEVAVLFETAHAFMVTFGILPGLYVYFTKASEEACRSYVVGSVGYNVVISAVLLRRVILGLPIIGPDPSYTLSGVVGTLLHSGMAFFQVLALMRTAKKQK
ncbi:hypothetical protein BJ742DRAFT_790358 [Cladochytrium replicatum]|nr:hypothetical protein BJ742DRAFT_790358 [Cladochytrium replicatum]